MGNFARPPAGSIVRPIVRAITSAIFGSSSFNPLTLFAAAAQGAWYDPSDISTLFQDSAGTVPVTTAGQNVLRMNDKSGNGNHATNTTGANYYVYNIDSAGSPCLLPTTGAEFLQFPQVVLGLSGDFDMIGVTRYIAAGNYSMFVTDSVNLSGMWVCVGYALDNTTIRPVLKGASSTKTAQPTSLGLATNYMVTATMRQATSSLAMGVSNSTTSASTYVAGSGAWVSSNYKIGAYAGFSSMNAFYGLVTRKSAFTNAEKDSVQGYYASKTTTPFPSTGIIVGDSTIAAYLGQNGVDFYMTSSTVLQNIAVPGVTTASQMGTYVANGRAALARWVMIEIGLNDLAPAEAASVAIARIQLLVDTVSKGTKAAIFISQMTPCHQRLIDLYGGVNGPIAYQKWLDMNTAIAGSGATPITGVAGRVTSHVAALGTAGDYLAAAYEIGGTNDHIHENNAGRQIIAAAWTAAITAAGVTV